MSLREKAYTGIKWNVSSKISIILLQFVTLAVLARILSPIDFGLMGMLMVVIGFARLFADAGISNAIIYRQDATDRELSSLYWLNIVSGAIIFIIVLLLTPLIISFYDEPRLKNLIIVAALIFLITPIGQQFQVLLQKELSFSKIAVVDLVSFSVNSIVSILLAIFGFGVFSLVYGQLAGSITRTSLLLFWLKTNWRPRLHFSMLELKGYLSFGLYQMGEKTVHYINSNLDYILIGSLLGAKALGYYSLAYNLVIKPFTKINPIFSSVAFPVFSKVQDNSNRLKEGYLKMIQVLSLLNFPLMFGLAILAPSIIPVFFGDQWIPSILLVQILTIVGLFRSISNPVGSLLMSRGRADLGFKWNVIFMVVQVTGLCVGALQGGTIGVAIAYAILQTLNVILVYPILIRPILGSCLYQYIGHLWPSFWISSVMAASLLLFNSIGWTMNQKIALPLQLLIGTIIFVSLLLLTQNKMVLEFKTIFLGQNK